MHVVKRGQSFAPCRRTHTVVSYIITNTLSVSTDGRKEKVMFDKITSRISKLCYSLNPDFVEPVQPTLTLSLYSVYVCVC